MFFDFHLVSSEAVHQSLLFKHMTIRARAVNRLTSGEILKPDSH